MGTTRKTVAIFWRESLRYPWRLTASLISGPLGIALQDMLLPLIAAQTLNKLVYDTQKGRPVEWAQFMPYLVAFVVIAVVSRLVIHNSIMNISRLQVQVRENLHNRVYHLLLAHSMHFHANSFSGALVSQAGRFANAYVAISDIVVTQALSTLTKLVVSVAILMFFSPPIAWALLVWTIFFVWLNITLTRQRIALNRKAAAAETELTAHLADSITNISAIKAFASEANESRLYGAKASARRWASFYAWRKAIYNGSVTASMMSLLQLTIICLSIYAVGWQHVQIGVLILAQVYITQLMGSLWNLSTLTRGLEQNFSDAAEMTEILGQEIEVKDPPKPATLQVTRGAIRFDHVDFSHTDADGEPLFKDFDLAIAPGEKVGLVGHSGSGKTTLTRILLRFADVNKGAITIDGQDISKVRQAGLRGAIAYVPQEPLLFHRSIHENIAYGKPGASQAEVAEAARLANAAEFIETLPKGYDTMVGERGVKLSGGQRQRIAIARAILKNAPILVLDEATSALDSESERLIQDALKQLMKGRTTIVIAHRLSTIQNMDRIVVLQDGRIIEQGSHSQLLKQGGTYADLWKHQSGGFLEE